MQNRKGERIGFGDDELVEFFLQSAKDFAYPVEGVLLKDRWVGKVFGFEGPIYLYKTGPFEVSISLEGVYFVTALPSQAVSHADLYGRFEQFVSVLRRRLEQNASARFGTPISAKTTYLTERGWQLGLGRLLEGLPDVSEVRFFGASESEVREQAQPQADSASEFIRPLKKRLLVSGVPTDAEWLDRFETLRHDAELIPLVKRLFEAMGHSAHVVHNPRDMGTDVLVTVSLDPKIIVSLQVKSHIEVVEDGLNDLVRAQRSRSSAYEADLYLVLMFANVNSKKQRRKGTGTEGALVRGRFADLKRQLQMDPVLRNDTEVVEPEVLAHLLRLELGDPT